MKKLKKEHIKQEVFDLYDAYAHNRIQRRDFVQKLSAYAVGGITVASLMSFLMPNYADTFLVDKNNPDLDSSFIIYNSPKGGGEIKGLLSKPNSADIKLPGIVVVHENRGLNPYVEDTARRAALEGFITLAPDALSPLGGYPGNDDEGREMQSTRDRNEMLEDFIAGFYYLKNHESCNGKIGVVGFCFGGWISNMMAVKVSELLAAVPFYGGQPTDGIENINAPLMLQYAGLDERVNAGWPDYEEALKKNDKEYEVFFYPDVNHGFHNTSTPRYDRPAAELAWQRTMDFFKEKLS
ncbi:dienelactone hydrolase family protein [Maribacter sp. X9]|uniref:dienelactone hydrolase family protein n=1 Tax=Maribacter sp. X9 TaxID=3402159 RepID=UPI003AF37EB1